MKKITVFPHVCQRATKTPICCGPHAAILPGVPLHLGVFYFTGPEAGKGVCMLNVEISGFVGLVEMGIDKKSGKALQKIVLMDDNGKQVKASSFQPSQSLATTKRGEHVSLRFTGLDYLMSEFGNLTFRAETVEPLQAKQLKAVNQ